MLVCDCPKDACSDTVCSLLSCRPNDAVSIVSAMRAQLAPLAAAEEPVSVHTFGFGSDHDPKLLQAIAEAGSGIYYYIQVAATIRSQ